MKSVFGSVLLLEFYIKKNKTTLFLINLASSLRDLTNYSSRSIGLIVKFKDILNQFCVSRIIYLDKCHYYSETPYEY